MSILRQSPQFQPWLDWMRSTRRSTEEDLADKHFDKYEEMLSQFYSKPRTPNWYRCWGACHWLAAWYGALGQLLFPNMEWRIKKGKKHSAAVGIDGPDKVFVDTLWDQRRAASEIWSAIRNGKRLSVVDEIEWQEARPYCQTTEDAQVAESVGDEDSTRTTRREEVIMDDDLRGEWHVLPALLTTKEAAKDVLNCGERTLWRWSRSGVAPAPIKINGRTVRYRRDELLAWIQSGCPRTEEGMAA